MKKVVKWGKIVFLDAFEQNDFLIWEEVINDEILKPNIFIAGNQIIILMSFL